MQGAPGGGGDKPAFWQAVLDLDEGERLDDFNAMPRCRFTSSPVEWFMVLSEEAARTNVVL